MDDMKEPDFEELFGSATAEAKADEEKKRDEEMGLHEDDLDAALDEVMASKNPETRREAFLRAFRNAQELHWR